jgi:hypothetical protein
LGRLFCFLLGLLPLLLLVLLLLLLVLLVLLAPLVLLLLLQLPPCLWLSRLGHTQLMRLRRRPLSRLHQAW